MSEYFLILEAVLMSQYLSPIDTINPPRIDGSTVVVIKMDCPDFTNDFKAASNSCCKGPSSAFAVVTWHLTSPRWADINVAKELAMPSNLLSLPFSANNPRKLPVNFEALVLPIAELSSSFFLTPLVRGTDEVIGDLSLLLQQRIDVL